MRSLRPANFAPQCPGRGWGEYSVRGGPICVIILMGRFTLDSNTDNPFVIADGYMAEIKEKIIVPISSFIFCGDVNDHELTTP